jgi:hypothetical protein
MFSGPRNTRPENGLALGLTLFGFGWGFGHAVPGRRRPRNAQK